MERNRKGNTVAMIVRIAGKEVQQSSSNSWVPDFIEGPYKDLAKSAQELNQSIENIGYWVNPKNWVVEAWNAFEALIVSPDTATWLLGGTIIGIWLVMLGAKWPKKWVFWGWIVYWTFRGFIFV